MSSKPLSLAAFVHVLGEAISLAEVSESRDAYPGGVAAPALLRPRLFSARRLPNLNVVPTSSISSARLSLITHHPPNHGIASEFFRLLDDHRLAIRIAESCLCSQPGHLFVSRLHSPFRSTASLPTHHRRRVVHHAICAPYNVKEYCVRSSSRV
jgi:hypothetical protein